MCKWKNYSLQKKQENTLMLVTTHCENGMLKEKLKLLDLENPASHTDDTKLLSKKIKMKNNKILLLNKKYAMPEYQAENKKKIWKDKLISSNQNIQTILLSKILEADLTSKEKVLKPYWTKQSKEISKNLSLPTKTDCVDLVLSCSNKSSLPIMGKSWFSITENVHQNKNSLMMSSLSSQYSLPDYMGGEVIEIKETKNKTWKHKDNDEVKYKSLRFRLFPNEEQISKLDDCQDQNKWTWNMCVTTFLKENPLVEFKHQIKNSKKKIQIKQSDFRDNLRKYKYVEEEFGYTTDGRKIVIADFVKDENQNDMDLPDWWNFKHNRVHRGAIYYFVSSLNSSISNYKNHDRDFTLNYRKKKSKSTCFFEDTSYPTFINDIDSYYGYTQIVNGKRKRVSISIKEMSKHIPIKGFTIVKEHDTSRYYLNLPVPVGFYLPDDKYNESQVMFSTKEDIIALDPGVRTFLTGYTLNKSCDIGEGDAVKIFDLLDRCDKLSTEEGMTEKEIETINTKKRKLRSKIKNMVDDLHWKSIKYLTSNYKCIIYPDFRTKGMMRKIKDKPTKRKLQSLSFFKFKQRLIYKCKTQGKTLMIMNEAYTSRTCSRCGFLNPKSTRKDFRCGGCDWMVDRDYNGARNIMIKTLGFFIK